MSRSWMTAAIGLLVVGSTVSGAEPQRWALLVGVNDYVGFTDLRYSSNDAAALAETLRDAGFEARRIVLLHDGAKDSAMRPTKGNIERQLNLVLNLAAPDDLVVVSFSGHGVHIDGKSYLCPTEANDSRPEETMIAVDDVYSRFNKCAAALKLLVVDACRNDPRPAGKRSATPELDRKSLGASFERPPDGIVVLASCAPGQISWEDEDLGHGVFMYHLLKGISGDADGNANGRITLGELYDFAGNETKLYVANRFRDLQIPAQRGEINGIFEFSQAGLPKKRVNSINMKLSLIPVGEFLMGSADDDPNRALDEMPQHRVRITKPFYLGTHEVTRGQFGLFIRLARYQTEAETNPLGGWGYNATTGLFEAGKQYGWQNPGFPQTDEHPVTNVSWDDAVAFCQWLSSKENAKYRLPTEAEWEYACRAGTTSTYPHGEDAAALTEYGNVADARFVKAKPNGADQGLTSDDGFVFTAPVGRFKSNGFGLYDMNGNVWEWCEDWYDAEYYKTSRIDDPGGFTTGVNRVYRGSGWMGTAWYCRTAARANDTPVQRSHNLGFRVVREP